jgi:hypothetical protein
MITAASVQDTNGAKDVTSQLAAAHPRPDAARPEPQRLGMPLSGVC